MTDERNDPLAHKALQPGAALMAEWQKALQPSTAQMNEWQKNMQFSAALLEQWEKILQPSAVLMEEWVGSIRLFSKVAVRSLRLGAMDQLGTATRE